MYFASSLDRLHLLIAELSNQQQFLLGLNVHIRNFDMFSLDPEIMTQC